jgi:hypothetical protein
MKRNINEKAEILKIRLKDADTFTVSDAASILDEEKKTIYWTLWKLCELGYFSRIGKGLYAFSEKNEKVEPILSILGQKVRGILDESGYKFFISGLDVLSVFMEHIPESYPVLFFVERNGFNDILELLQDNGIDVIDMKNYPTISRIYEIKHPVLLNPTNEFQYAEDSIASFEKAFVDTFYEVTRRKFPLPLQELARIFLNMKRRISLNTSRMIKIASRRSIQKDIRYIVENENISKAAYNFVEYLDSSR